ncbi:MAG: apolipoprotein N-acyltransferase [Planctomycetota bacterium]
MLRRPPQLAAHLVALTLSAVLLALSFPLPGGSFLAWVALAPAGWLAATSRRPWTLVWTSAVVFGLWWAWMLRWLLPVTPPGAVAVAVFQSLFWVVALWATNVCVRRQRVPIAVALPLCWVTLEFVRSTWPWGGFAWFTLAQTQGAWRPFGRMPLIWMESVVAATGAAGLSFALALYAGGWVQAAFGSRISTWGCTVMLLATFFGLVVFNPAITRSYHDMGVSVTSSVVQTNTPHDNKLWPTAETYEADFAALRRLHAEAAEANPALIVWPETVIPGPFNEPAAAHLERWALSRPNDEDGARLRARTGKPRQARALVSELGVPTMIGASTEIATDDPRDPQQFNSAYLVTPDGRVNGRFDKMHRVPFGEYIPLPEALKDWVLATVSPYDFDYSIDAGEAVTVFEVPAETKPGETESGGLRFATPICFEDTNAALCREMVYDPATGKKRVDALVNLTTNGWFGRLPTEADAGGLGWASMRYQHLQLASLRAIENRVPVVRSVNTGVSAIIDSTGRIVAAAPPGQEAVISGELVLDPRRTVYAIVGDWPIMGLAVFTAGLVVWSRLRAPKAVRRRRGRLRASRPQPAA